MGIIAAPSLTLPQIQAGVRRQSILTRVLPTRAYNTLTVTAGRTIQQAIALEADFEAVRLIYSTTAAGYTMNKAVMSPSSVFAVQPKTEAGANPTWVPVTFDGGGANTAFPATFIAGSVRGLTIADPGASGLVDPFFAFSDWMPLRSFARTDGGTLPLLYVRSYYDTTATATQVCGSGPSAIFDPSAVSYDRLWGSWQGGGDSTTADYTGAPPPRSQFSPVIGVQYLLRGKQGVTVMFGGDSITQGTTTNSELRSWAFLACAQASDALGIPVSHVNAGWASQSSLLYYNRVARALAAFTPEVLVFAPWSPNDVQSMSAAYDSFALAMKVSELCRQRGTRLILWTPIPAGLLTTTGQAAAREWVCTQVRNWGAAGNTIIDLDAVMRDGGVPSHLIPAFTNDNLHPNDLGAEAMAPVARAAITRALLGR